LDITMAPEGLARPSRGRWPFLETIGWGVLILIVSTLTELLMFGAFAAVDLYNRHDTNHLSLPYVAGIVRDEAVRGNVVFATIIVSNLVSVAAILLIVLTKGHELKQYLSFYRVRLTTVVKWMAVLAAFAFLTEGSASLFGVDFGGEGMLALYRTTDSIWLFWAAAVVAAPLFEEVMFRGFLFHGFRASFLGTGGAIVLTALLWAAMHIQYNLYGMAFIAGTGILLGIARARTGSLIVPLSLHAALNFSDMVLYAVGGT
jgi:membrane protease YdiL (CAAX protease family)